jgi:PHD/YefM family antitoxin component YafN of YafNO toxin-antitoxin module
MTTQTVTIQVDQSLAEIIHALMAKAEMEGTNPAGLLTVLRESGEPLILAINGGDKAVMQEASSYQQLLEDLDRAEATAGVRRGMDAVKAGKTRPVREFLAELRQEFGFPETRPEAP